MAGNIFNGENLTFIYVLGGPIGTCHATGSIKIRFSPCLRLPLYVYIQGVDVEVSRSNTVKIFSLSFYAYLYVYIDVEAKT